MFSKWMQLIMIAIYNQNTEPRLTMLFVKDV